MKNFKIFITVLFGGVIFGSYQTLIAQNDSIDRTPSDGIEVTKSSMDEVYKTSDLKNVENNDFNEEYIYTSSPNKVFNDSAGSSKGFGIAGCVMGILTIISLFLTFMFLLKRIKELENKINNSISINRNKKNDTIILENKVKLLEISNEELINTIKSLQISFDKMEEELKKNITYSSGSSSSIPSIKHGEENEKNIKSDVKFGNTIKKDKAIFYAASLSIDERGNLSIPSFELNPTATGFLFKVELDTEKGSGTYELNPNAENIVGNLDLLRQFSEGISQTTQITYKTVSPGSLKQIDSNWIVIKKLVLE